MKTIQKYLLILLLAIGMFSAYTAQAGVLGNKYPICSLAIFPYWPSQPEIIGDAGNAFVNFRNDLCSANLSYPSGAAQAYPASALTDAQTPLVSGGADHKVPIAFHEHSYYNDSVDDSKYYKSFVKAFQIKLQPDAVSNIDKFYCDYPYPGAGFVPPAYTSIVPSPAQVKAAIGDVCASWKGATTVKTAKINNLWGGTELVYDPSASTLTWIFAVDNTDWYPVFYGDNRNTDAFLDNIIGLDTSIADNRKFTFNINLETKDLSAGKSIWSATTTSKVLLRNSGVSKADAKSNPAILGQSCSSAGHYEQGWCSITAGGPVVSSYNGQTLPSNYFWFDIGNVVSIWKSPSTPPPSDVACSDLQWDGAFQKKTGTGTYAPDLVNPNALLENEAAIMKFKTIYDSGSGTKRPLEYRWVSFNGEQNRPTWFKNDDSLFYGPVFVPVIIPITASLPGKLLTVAHAALVPAGGESSAIKPPSSIITAMIDIGAFKDEVGDTLSGNPILDTDNQAWYSGGSEGVTLGVQAFYSDGKNEAGQGAMVNTPGGLEQKAEKCHLELKIQPPPAICVGLTIAPTSVNPNTPVTFTVTPKFSPASSSIPLNYYWEAKAGTGLTPKVPLIPIVLPTAYNPKESGEADIFGTDIAKAALPPSGGSSKAIIPPVKAPSGTDIVDKDGATAQEILYGAFKDYLGGPLFPTNPFLETTDNKTYYTGGPAGTHITVQGQGKDGKVYPACSASLTLPPLPPEAKCQILKVKFFDGSTEVAIDKLAAGKTYTITIDKTNSKKTDGTLISNYSIMVNNSAGPGTYGTLVAAPGNAASCSPITGAAGTIGTPSTSVDCKYNYTPNGNDKITLSADPNDGVPACTVSQVIPPAPPAMCMRLVATFMDGATTIAKEAMVPGKTYTIGIYAPGSQKTDGTLIANYSIKLNNIAGPGAYGTLVPTPGNPAGCSDITGAAGTIGTPSTPVVCKYNYTPNAGDTIVLSADPNDGVAACSISQSIAGVGAVCKSLNLTTSPLISGSEIAQGQNVAFTTDPRDTNSNPRNPVVYTETGSGNFVANPANAASCPAVPASSTSTISFEAANTCKYSYQAPSDGTTAAVSIKVKQDDAVADCTKNFTVPSTPTTEQCLALNLQVNGAYTLNPLLTPGDSYALQASPITTKGNPVINLAWTENGAGQLVGQPSNPAICPAIIDNGTVVTPSFCRYIYAGGTSSSDGFSVKAVPDDGNVNCQAASSSFTPPPSKPFCLYLDLSHNNPDTYDGVSSDLVAVVVMSDGSKYNDHVRFTSSDGSGTFNGGYSPIFDGGTNNFRSSTDSTNSTQTVHFGGGSGSTGLNIFLADTSVLQSAACQRQLTPVTPPTNLCTLPPKIVREGDSTKFTATGGDSDQYCWSISGEGNPIFNNGHNTTTGTSVILNDNYPNFNLHVEDCNPAFKSFCSDNYVAENTPKISKSISEDSSPLHYTDHINYSTKEDNIHETVHYAINYTPADVKPGYSLSAKIYDPAFTGQIQGYKTPGEGGTKVPSGTIDFSGINSTIKVSGFSACSPSATPIDHCYFVNSSGFLLLQGITSPDPITIEYSGQLTSGITTKECQAGTACNEQFINQSFVTDMQFCQAVTDSVTGTTTYPCTSEVKPANQTCQYFYNDKGERQPVSGSAADCNMPTYTIATNTTVAELVCQYFLTRASGDVFLEDQLTYGVDVSKCYPFKNVSSTIVTPAAPINGHLIKTGTPEVVTINHEICSAGQSNFNEASFNKLNADTKASLKQLFGEDLTTLSSQICEVGLVPGSDWDKDTIKASIDQNIGKLTRWESGIPTGTHINGVTDFSGGIYYYEGTGSGDTVNIDSLNIPEGSGPLTIIVKNADLQINSDINYQASGATVTDPKMISSLGVIVLDGNMYVDPKVKTLSGAYFVQRSDAGDLTKGNILSGTKASPDQNSDVGLTVYGSIYGNIGNLFKDRTAAGDVAQDQGAITIRYDQRIIQNPPQGLAEILGSFSQSQVAQ